MKTQNFFQLTLLVIISFCFVSCRKNTDALVPPVQDSTKQLNKITITTKGINYRDSISVTLKSGNLISEIYRDFHNTISNTGTQYTTKYYYDGQNRVQRMETDNPNSIIGSLSFTYAGKTFYSAPSYHDSLKKDFLSKIRIDVNPNSTINFNRVHTGDSIILNYDWMLGTVYGQLGSSFSVSSSPSFNKYPYADFENDFQLYTDYLWDIDTAGLLKGATSQKGLAQRKYQYNDKQQLINAVYAYTGCGGCPWTINMQMDITWDTTKFSLPFLTNFNKDIYWVSNIELPLWDPVNDYDITYGYPNVTGNLAFILSNFKTISYRYKYNEDCYFENTYTNSLLTRKIMKNATGNNIIADYTIKYE